MRIKFFKGNSRLILKSKRNKNLLDWIIEYFLYLKRNFEEEYERVFRRLIAWKLITESVREKNNIYICVYPLNLENTVIYYNSKKSKKCSGILVKYAGRTITSITNT